MDLNLNGIDVEALNSLVDEVRHDAEKGKVAFKVKTKWKGQTRTVSTVSAYELNGIEIDRNFEIPADEPTELLGNNTAANPQELLMAALNACMSVGYAANATAMGIKLDSLEIETEGKLDLRGFLGLNAEIKPGYEVVHFAVRIKSDSPRQLVEQLHQRVMKTSPNFSNFSTSIRMVPRLVVEGA
ncbi:OsmC family protein [Paraburkholderia jirisanensis]